MNFGSKYVYYYQGGTDEESVSSDSDSADDSGRITTPLDVDDDGFDGPVVASAGLGKVIRKGISKVSKGLGSSKKKKKPPVVAIGDAVAVQATPENGETPDPPVAAVAEPKTARKLRKKADSNVFTLDVGDNVRSDNAKKVDKLIDCGSCKALLPSFSKFEAGGRNWKCEFCAHDNPIADLTGWVKPTEEDVTYELEPPAAEFQGQQVEDKHIVIFVIDISGSMSSTQTCDVTDASGRRTRSFVSRLDSVKRAAEHEIRQLLEKSPNVKVGLITFGTQVTIYGDGTGRAKILSDEETERQERLKGAAADFPQLKPIKETFNALTRVLMGLDIRGMTALGPGLLSGVSLAANVKGSKVIICTDGCANVGFGALPENNCDDEDEISSSRAVYRELGEYAKQESVTVSVISLQGTDCRLVHLGLVAQITGGVVDIVDPNNMSTQFGNILGSKTLATDVSVTLILHHSLYIREVTPGPQKSTKTQNLGNVDSDTEVVVEFGVRTVSNENEQPMSIEEEDRLAAESTAEGAQGGGGEIEVAGADTIPASLPFQVQLVFTARNGGKYKRVITHRQECTENREKAESAMNMNIVGAATSSTVSNVALAGHFRQAKHAVKARQKMTQRYRGMSRGKNDADADKMDVDCLGDFEMDLDCLESLVDTQTRNVTQRSAANQYCSDSAPLDNNRFKAAPTVQAAGLSSRYMAGNAPQTSKKLARPSTASAVNAMSDNIAHQYYARSKGGYAGKKKAKPTPQ